MYVCMYVYIYIYIYITCREAALRLTEQTLASTHEPVNDLGGSRQSSVLTIYGYVLLSTLVLYRLTPFSG